MADLTKTVEILFQGTDQLSSTISGMSRKIDAFGGQVTSATQPLADMSQAALKAEAALIALAVGGLALATTEAGNFGVAFGEISTLIELPADKLEGFRQDILRYAADSTLSIDDINASIYTAISAGADWADSIDVVSRAEKLAVGGKAELEATTRVLVSTLNAYGESADKAGEFSDYLFTTVRLGQTTIPELANNLAQVTNIAAIAGVPFDELSAAIAALTATGAPTDQAITQIKGAITSILKPTSEAAKVAAQLGIDFNATALKTKGLDGVLRDVQEATGGSADQISILFGNVRAFAAAAALGADRSGKYAQALKEMGEATGATEAAFEKMSEVFDRVNQNIVNNIRLVLIEIGDKLLDEYIDLGQALSNIFKGVKVGIGSEAFSPLFAALDRIADDLVKSAEKIADAIPEALEDVDLTDFVDSIYNLGDAVQNAFAAIFGDIDLTTPEGLTSAIQKIVNAISALTNVTAGIVNAWAPFLEAISEAVDKFADADANTQELTGRILGFGDALNSVFKNIGALTGALNVIAGALSVLSATQLVSAVGGFGSLASKIGVAGSALGLFGQAAASFGIGYAVGDQLRKLFPVIDTTAQKFLEITDRIFNWSGAMETSTRNIDAERAALEAVRARIEENKKAIEDLPDTKATEFTAVNLDTISDDLEVAKDSIEGIPDQKNIEIKAEADTASFKEAEQIIVDILPDGSVVLIQADLDRAKLEKAKAEIDKIPTEKLIEIELQGEIDKEVALIEGRFDLLQSAAKFKAELDIANIEADTEKVKSAFEAINNTVTSTGDVLSDALGLLSGVEDFSTWAVIERQIREESRRRDSALKLQEELTAEQIRYMEARRKAIESGQAMIEVKADGLEQELEAFMWKILERVQVRAIEEQSEFLLGIG